MLNVVMSEVLTVSVYAFRAGDDRNVTFEQERDGGQYCGV